jgi:leucyl aminopeptidase
MFLKQFVKDTIPWAHIDIAGVSDLEKGTAYSAPGATGFGIRLILDWLQKN